VHLQELLQVQVRHLGLVIHTQQLGQRGVGEDAALERGVIAVVALHVLGDELGHLGLGALLRGLDAHERGQLGGQRLLLQERIVRAASLPGHALLRRQGSRVDLALLLRVARLLLRGLGGLLGRLDSLTHTARELGGQRLQLLRQGRQQGIARLRRGGRDGDSHNGHNHLGLGGGGLLRGLGRRRGGGGNGLGGLLGGLLVSGHLVCLRGRDRGGHF